MRLKTLRARVVFGASVAIATSLALLVVVFNLVLAGSLRHDLDSRLQSRARAAVTTVSVRGATVIPREGPGDAALDNGIWVLSGDRVVERPRAEPELDRAVLRFAATGAGSTSDSGYRLRAEPVLRAGRRVGTVVAAASLAAYDHSTDVAEVGSALFAVVILLISTGALWVATGRALKPVDEMVVQAAGWGAHDVEHRFGEADRPLELDRLADTFDGLLARIAASLRHEQRLSAEISHELRTPLAQLSAQAELLAQRPHDEAEQREAAVQMLRSARRMEATLATLMSAARAEAGAPPGVCDAARVLRELARDRGCTLAGDLPGGLAAGVDADVLERILSPLLDNAERYASGVAVGARREDGAVVIEVRDDGPGIPDQDLEAVFAPGRTGPGHDGAGLGLPLARRLARAVGGDVTAVPAARGAHLRVRLPAA